MSKLVTPIALATTLCNATPNLFGAILVRKRLDIRKSEVANAHFKGNLYKEYAIKGFATLRDYETAVNNAKERDEQERTFEVQERKWGTHWNGSPLIIVHKGRLYLQVRLTKNTVSEATFKDSLGNEYAYEDIERYLLSADRRETKHKSKVATAERQGLEVEDSVQIRDIPIDTIVELAYMGERYAVMPEAVGSLSSPIVEAEAEESEEQTQGA